MSAEVRVGRVQPPGLPTDGRGRRWITLIQNKAQALIVYDQYIQDAERAQSPECAALFRRVHDSDQALLAEAKQHLVKVLQGKMGGTGAG